jgi:hypothetical protein
MFYSIMYFNMRSLFIHHALVALPFPASAFPHVAEEVAIKLARSVSAQPRSIEKGQSFLILLLSW